MPPYVPASTVEKPSELLSLSVAAQKCFDELKRRYYSDTDTVQIDVRSIAGAVGNHEDEALVVGLVLRRLQVLYALCESNATTTLYALGNLLADLRTQLQFVAKFQTDAPFSHLLKQTALGLGDAFRALQQAAEGAGWNKRDDMLVVSRVEGPSGA